MKQLQFSFSGPLHDLNQSPSEFQLKVFIPKLTIHTNTNEDWKIMLLSIKPRGNVIINMGMYIAVVVMRQYVTSKD